MPRLTKDFGFSKDKNIKYLEDAFNDFFNSKMEKMFPIGAIVITNSNANPVELGYPGTRWESIGSGRMLVNCGSAPFDGNPGTEYGNAGSTHDHIIYGMEDIPSQWPLDHDERQIYADLIAANQPNIDQKASKEASGVNEPIMRFLLHSDTSHAQYEYAEYTREEDAPASYVPYELGKLELRPTWPVTVDLAGNVYTESANRIKAEPSGSGTDLINNYPPCMLTHIWKRTA